MRSVRNHNDPTDVAGNFGAVVHSRDMAYQHDDQNVQADRPRAGRKYLTERGATRSPPTTVATILCSPSLLVRDGERSVTMTAAIGA